MPFDVKKRGKKYLLLSQGSGRTLGTHSSKSSARRQQKAVYANYKGKK